MGIMYIYHKDFYTDKAAFCEVPFYILIFYLLLGGGHLMIMLYTTAAGTVAFGSIAACCL